MPGYMCRFYSQHSVSCNPNRSLPPQVDPTRPHDMPDAPSGTTVKECPFVGAPGGQPGSCKRGRVSSTYTCTFFPAREHNEPHPGLCHNRPLPVGLYYNDGRCSPRRNKRKCIPCDAKVHFQVSASIAFASAIAAFRIASALSSQIGHSLSIRSLAQNRLTAVGREALKTSASCAR